MTIPAPWSLPLSVRERILTELRVTAAARQPDLYASVVASPVRLRVLVHRASFRKGTSVSKMLGRG